MRLDPTDQGEAQRWFSQSFPTRIKLPGSLPQQGIGNDVAIDTPWTGEIIDRSWFDMPQYAPYRQAQNISITFWLQPDKVYKGAAWYQHDVEVPAVWRDQHVVLFLERPHWQTQLWVDGRAVGKSNALNTPHEYDLGMLSAGRHSIVLRVDNRMVVDIGENSHDISDHTQGNWNGIVGAMYLRARPSVWLDDLRVYPHVATKSVTVQGKIGNAGGMAGNGSIQLESNGNRKFVDARWESTGGMFEAELPLGSDAVPWDEFSPKLYTLRATLNTNAPISTTFGLRECSTDGTQFIVNGRKTFFRGTLECCIFPKTGHPPTDVAEWKRIIGVAKSYGLNLFRFHSYCPPEAAFIAADELGFYLQVETCWANNSTTLGDGKPVDQWVYDETDRILRFFGNHPSFVLMAYGNEPGGKNYDVYLSKYVAHYKELDPRRLWTSGSGWPQLPVNQFHVAPEPRIQHWDENLRSRINSKPPETQFDYAAYISAHQVPVISHEIGQWCVFPNFEEIPKYTGYLKPKNFSVFRASLAANHMADQAQQFLTASGKLQTLCYKEDIESALRTPGMGGFELLDLHDFPGQGTALVGVLDPFWEDKGYVTAAEYSRFCNSTVPLARLSKRVFTTGERLDAEIQVAHFGAAPIANAAVSWKLVADNGNASARGTLPPVAVPLGSGVPLGKISIDLAAIPSPARYKLVVSISGAAGKTVENDWDVWLYPSQPMPAEPADVVITHELNDQALRTLNAGGKVLLLIPPAKVKNVAAAPVKLGFSSIFWNTAWTRRQAPTTLGVLCDPKHPLFANFPTDFHSNWQWWYLVTRAAAMILDDFPAELRPTVQVIDDWVTNRRLALEFEAQVAGGKLVACSIDLDDVSDPVTRQFRSGLLRYMAGSSFDPKLSVSPGQIGGLIAQ
jgi:hypothetical protein